MSIQPVSYFQTDPRWKNIPYAVKGESSTIGGSGCGPSSAAMILATWADKNAYDEAANKLAQMFNDNFSAKYPNMPLEIVNAGPKPLSTVK